LFGPNYGKFREAKELITLKGAFPVSGKDDFSAQMSNLSAYPELLKKSGNEAKNYVINNLGATQKIYQKIFSK
jgi:3-deoxy-D-manno-octulosonic-acid transferase